MCVPWNTGMSEKVQLRMKLLMTLPQLTHVMQGHPLHNSFWAQRWATFKDVIEVAAKVARHQAMWSETLEHFSLIPQGE